LKVFRSETIARRKLRQLQKIINRELNHLGALALNELPIMEWDEFQHQVMQGQQWTVITGIVHDISGFVDKHPGGKALMLSALGKDATSRFQGGVYQHSTTAHNLLSDMRVAILRGGLELDKH
jgi:stearoyl-CoA desaturase (delta-9 desaturase)